MKNQTVREILDTDEKMNIYQHRRKSKLTGQVRKLKFLLSYCIQAVITKLQRLGGLETTNVFLMILEAGKVKIKALVDLVSGKNLLLH